jgi:hypothetical protein
MPPLARRALVALAHLLLALVVTAPLITSPLGRLVGSGDVDVWNHAWGPWWWWDALSRGELPWETTLLAYPRGGVLWFIDPVLAAGGAPLVPLLGPAGAYNAMVVLYVAFASWAAGRFAQALGVDGAARWVASAAFAGSAWIVCEVHNGITEAFDVGFVALALAWTEDAARTPSWRAWAKAGLGIGLAAVASPYLGLGAGVYALVRGLPAIRQAWLGAIVAVLVAAPPALGLRAQLHSDAAIIKHPESMNDQLALHNAVDPRTFLAPLGFRSVDLSAEGFEHSMYLGLLALGLALVGLWRLRRGAGGDRFAWLRAPGPWIGLAALVSLVFALGPYLYWGDGWATLGDSRLRLPWWAIQKLAPGLAVTHPLRLGVPALAAVAGLAAVGAARLTPGRRSLVLAALVLIDGLIISGAPWPMSTADARPPEALVALARDAGSPPGDSAVLDLPTDAGETMATSRYLWWQTAHGRPIVYGPDARASTSPLIHDSAFRTLAAASTRRADEAHRLQLGGAADRAATRSLRDIGIRWVVVHHDLDEAAGARLEALLTTELGPGMRTGAASVWDLGEPPPVDQRRGLAQPRHETPGAGPSPDRAPSMVGPP